MKVNLSSQQRSILAHIVAHGSIPVYASNIRSVNALVAKRLVRIVYPNNSMQPMIAVHYASK